MFDNEQQAVLNHMKYLYKESKYPFVGTFWYDTISEDIVNITHNFVSEQLLIRLPHYNITGISSHRTIFDDLKSRNKHCFVTDDINDIYYGRVVKNISSTDYYIFTNNWIDKFPNVKELITLTYNLENQKLQYFDNYTAEYETRIIKIKV